MTKPTNNLERLEAIRRGLEKILEKRKGEQERWLKALGGIKETALTDLRLAAGIGQVEGMLREIDTVIKTDYCLCEQSEGNLPSAETARGAGEIPVSVPPDDIYAEARRRLGKAMGEGREIVKVDRMGSRETIIPANPELQAQAQGKCAHDKYVDLFVSGGKGLRVITREKLHVPHEINERFKLPDSWPDDFRRGVIVTLVQMMQSEGEEKARGWLDGLFPGYDFNTEFSFQELAEQARGEVTRERAIQERLGRVKRGSQGFHIPPETMEQAVALRGEGVKDRIASTEAEALLRMGSGDMARKHTAEDTQAVRAFVRKALELPFHRRDKLFHDLGLIKLSESVGITELETIKIAFRKARESGRESMETLITEVNKLHAGLKQ